MQKLVLVVDDDPAIVTLVKIYLERDGYRVATALDGKAALAQAARLRPDLVVLDLMLPGIDGLQVCTELRRESEVPIIMLTARSTERDKLVGLELGADDYVTKPFSPRELAARVRAVLRRTAEIRSGPEEFRVGQLYVNAAAHTAELGGRSLRLTPTEFRLLWTLARSPGQVLSRPQLIEHALRLDYEGFDRTIDVHITNLRRKVAAVSGGRHLIKTVWGVGYKLEAISV